VELSPDAASMLGGHNHWLYLDGLPQIDAQTAAILSLRLHRVRLNNLEVVTPEVVEALRKGNTVPLSLDRVTELNVQAAAALARHQGRVSLNGLQLITPETAAALSPHRAGLSMRGLDKNRNHPQVFDILATIEGIALPDWFYTGGSGPAK
jgi:hypothetical protein